MKKIILILVIIMSLGLGGCVSTSVLHDYKEELDQVSLELTELKEEIDNTNAMTEAQLEVLELSLIALQLRLDNMTSTVGLNDQVSYYENVESIVQTMSTVQMSITQLKDTFNKDRAPSYIVDELGNYISFEKLGYKLKLKYFGDDTINDVDMFDNGTDSFLRIGIESDMAEEEVLARILLMVNELRNYALYSLNCNRVIVHVYRFDDYDHQTKLTINQTIILNDYFTILPDGAYYEDYDMKLESDTELDLVLIETYYNNFISSGIFDGYVLDFK